MAPTNEKVILAVLAGAKAPLCDDCLAARAGLAHRQTAFKICTALATTHRVVRERQACGACGKAKNTNCVSAGVLSRAPLAERVPPLEDRAELAQQKESDEKSWHWEGHVQDALAAFLMAEGWKITSKADTASREPGIDIVAAKDGRWLAVEVKGYPTTTYERGPRRGMAKPTSPSSQARQWFSHALLSMMLLRHKRPDAEIALCFPDFKTFRHLAAGTRACFEALGFGIYFVSRDGRVALDVPHHAVGGTNQRANRTRSARSC